jgi:hypothetical protein
LKTTGPFEDLPIEVRQKLLSLVKEIDDDIAVPDQRAFVNFVQEYGKQYPVLFQLLKLDEEAIRSHYERTGEVPPGIKMTMKSQRVDSNIVDLTVIYGTKSSGD